MSAGILTHFYKTKIQKAKTPLAYFFAVQEYLYYEAIVGRFNAKERVKQFFDKYH